MTPYSDIPTVGDSDLVAAIQAAPDRMLAMITEYRMRKTAEWVELYIRERDKATAAETKHSKLLSALKTHEQSLKRLGEEFK